METVERAAQPVPPVESEPVGIITGRSAPQSFTFVSRADSVPPRLEYVTIRGAREKVDEALLTVDVLAQVTDISADVYTLDETIDFDGAQTVLEQAGTFPPGYAPRPRYWASCWTARCARRVTRCSPGRRSTPPRTTSCGASSPASSRTSISLGTLFNRRGVEVKLDPNGLSRHLAIIAQTGAGKSYLAGKILEDLLGLGATIIVLDPNSDYVQLRKVIEDERVPYRQARLTEHAGRIDLYRVPGIQNRRYSEDLVGPSRPYTIRFSDLEAEDLCDVAGVPQNAERIREAVGNACARLRQRHVDFDPTDLARELALFAGVPLDEPDPQPASRLEAPPPHPLHPAPAAPADQGDVKALPVTAGPGDVPDGDDVDAASLFLGRLGPEAPGGDLGWGANGPPGGGAPAGPAPRPARRTRCGPPGWPCVTSRSWCRTRCGGTPTSTSTASWPPCS